MLIVEDDDVIGRGMAGHLSNAGFEPLVVEHEARRDSRACASSGPTSCVLDLMLPGLDGWSLIETVRAEGIGTPILVVSARGTEQDRVKALELGADDYLVKPFSMRELVARVRAAVRRGVRAQEETRGDPIEIEELLIDPRERAGVRRRRERRPDADGIPPAARPRPGAGSRRHPRGADATDLGPTAAAPRPHR